MEQDTHRLRPLSAAVNWIITIAITVGAVYLAKPIVESVTIPYWLNILGTILMIALVAGLIMAAMVIGPRP